MIYNAARPMTFDEVKGQELIVENIRNQSIRGEFFPVIILCGQYGSGKTTMARLIAMSANCKHKDGRGNPCGQCDSCRAVKEHTQDGIIEIDGASNNGVDAIRSLIEQMNMLNVYEKKVIVIDEAHMLSKAAWNALLITLENPPEHCIVIMCTTEKDALPATVVSRAPVYMFGKIPDRILKEQILEVAEKNQIQIEADAAGVLARYADGAMRNALQLLEHLALQRPGECITEKEVVQTLGLSSMSQRSAFLRGCLNGNVEEIVKMLNSCYEHGINLRTFLQDTLKMNTDLLLTKSGVDVVGTEYYRQELNALKESCTDRNIVRLNQILSRLCTVPGNQLSVERVVVDMISIVYREPAVVEAPVASESISKQNVVKSMPTISEAKIAAPDGAKKASDVPQEAGKEQSSASQEDTSTAKETNMPGSGSGSSFSGFGTMMGSMGFGGFGGFPVMSSEKSQTRGPACAGSSAHVAKSEAADTENGSLDITGAPGFGMLSMSMRKSQDQSTDTFSDVTAEECPFEEEGAAAMPDAPTPGEVEVPENMESDSEKAADRETVSLSGNIPAAMPKEPEAPELLKDSKPVEERGQVSWDDMSALGVTENREDLVLPVPPSREDVLAEYERQEEERDTAEEEAASRYKTRADLANARIELGKLLKNPGFEMLYKKARLEEVDYEIHLYFKNIVQLKAVQLMLLNSKGIIAELDK